MKRPRHLNTLLKIALPLLLGLAIADAANAHQVPDHRGEIALPQPTYQGTHASAPIPPHMHFKNEGGSDGAGLCVICSVIIAGKYQEIPGLEIVGPDEHGNMIPGKGSKLWRTAKRRPGGYSPQKLAALVNEVMPGEKWASYEGTDRTVLDRLSRQGYAIGVTMSTGQLYQYRPIHHMVTLIHYRTGGLACVVDNNHPGFYHWMPAEEFDRRCVDGGALWAWWWLKLPTPVGEVYLVHLAGIGCLFIIALSLFAVGRIRRHTPNLEAEETHDDARPLRRDALRPGSDRHPFGVPIDDRF